MAISTVVASSYDTSGNGGRRIVRLDNGWLVCAVSDTSTPGMFVYVSKDKGQTWIRLCYATGMAYKLENLSLVAKGNVVYILGDYFNYNVRFFKVDAATQTDVNIWNSGIMVEPTDQTAIGSVSLTINEAGTELHAAWSSKNSTYPNSFNIRYAKGTIDGSGNVTWGSVVQVTKYNESGINVTAPCVVVKDGFPYLIVSDSFGNYIRIFSTQPMSMPAQNNFNWNFSNIYHGGSYTQFNPCAVVDNAGVIHVVWHGDTSSTTGIQSRVYYSKSTDGGVTWSTAIQLVLEDYQEYATIGVDKKNTLYVLWSGKSGPTSQLRMIKYENGAWSSITNYTSGSSGAYDPSIMSAESGNMIGWIYEEAATPAIKFDSITFNQNPTLTLTSPSINLLGTAGNCESLTGWRAELNCTLAIDNSDYVQGSGSIKATLSGNGYAVVRRFIKSLINNGKYYLVIAAAKPNVAKNLRLNVERSGLVPSSDYFTQSAWSEKYVKFSGSEMLSTSPNEVYLDIETSTSGWLAGETFNFDAVRLYEISKEVYDKIGVDSGYTGDNLIKKFPYTDPNNNLSLAEGNQLQLEGTVGDTDNGNVVTVKFKINGGTARAIASGVSDGSSPISFAKNLTYSNKRLWDGSTDVAGADLVEGVDHTLTVWAEDDQGGKSAEVTRIFRVIWNRPPVIDGADGDLGTKSAPFSQTYTVTEPEGSSFTITEMLNGVTKRTFTGTAGQQESFTITEDEWLRLDLGVQHEIRIRATDSQGLFSERVYTFTRTETEIVFELNYDNLDVVAFFGTLDAKPYRILVTLDAVVPEGADYIVEACNNFYDVAPVWEDITNAVKAKRGHIFVNETNSATQWAINIRVTAQRGTATERLIIKGFGGAFD